MPILPPLKKVFAVIEAQREEEAALGDAPLDQLLMPVPVPDEIVPPPEINELDPNAREMPIPVAEAEPSMPGMGMEGPLPEHSWPGEQGDMSYLRKAEAFADPRIAQQRGHCVPFLNMPIWRNTRFPG